MKFFVSADMEGIAAAVSWKEYENDYARLRKMFTAEVKAVCDGIIQTGVPVDALVVCDAHSSGLNLLIEDLPEVVSLARGSGRRQMMMEGLDATFDLVFFVGYHCGAGIAPGQMDHTYSSRSFYRVRVNGTEADEAMLNAALAGAFGVPLGFLSGDDQLVRQARRVFGPIETVVTKRAVSRAGAIARHPAAVQRELQAGAARAVRRMKEFRPFRFGTRPGPVTLELEMADSMTAALAALIPGGRQLDGRRLRLRADNMREAYRLLRLAAILAASAYM